MRVSKVDVDGETRFGPLASFRARRANPRRDKATPHNQQSPIVDARHDSTGHVDSTRDGSTGDGSTGDGSTRDGSTRDDSTRDDSTRDDSTRDDSTRDDSRDHLRHGSTWHNSTGHNPTGHEPRSDEPTPFLVPVSLVLASGDDLHRVPWLLPNAKYYACEVLVLHDDEAEIDSDACSFLNAHGVLVRPVAPMSENANIGLDEILRSAAGDVIVALDSDRCGDVNDVADLLAGDLRGAAFTKDVLILGDTDSRSFSNGRWEASVASRYSKAHGTPIRDFGVGSFVLRTNMVAQLLSVSRPPTGPGSPLGREALGSLAVAASFCGLTIFESPVYACERDTETLDPKFLDHITATERRTNKPRVTWHLPESIGPREDLMENTSGRLS